MKKRIKELAEQAGLSYMPSNYPDMADLYKCADFELEKFAELIVLECCKVSDDIEPYELPHKTSKFIKLHFGVEE